MLTKRCKPAKLVMYFLKLKSFKSLIYWYSCICTSARYNNLCSSSICVCIQLFWEQHFHIFSLDDIFQSSGTLSLKMTRHDLRKIFQKGMLVIYITDEKGDIFNKNITVQPKVQLTPKNYLTPRSLLNCATPSLKKV